MSSAQRNCTHLPYISVHVSSKKAISYSTHLNTDRSTLLQPTIPQYSIKSIFPNIINIRCSQPALATDRAQCKMQGLTVDSNRSNIDKCIKNSIYTLRAATKHKPPCTHEKIGWNYKYGRYTMHQRNASRCVNDVIISKCKAMLKLVTNQKINNHQLI